MSAAGAWRELREALEESREPAPCEALPEAWFESLGMGAEVRAACGRCLMREACLEYALEADERYGVWGGLDREQRKALRGRAS